MKKKKGVIQFIIVTAAVITLSLLYFFYPVTAGNFYPRCIFHLLTGLDCPGCGAQRAAAALLHGHLLRAIDFNLLFVMALPFVLYAAFVFSWNVFSTNKITQKFFYSVAFVRTLLVVIVVFCVLRNIPVQPLSWLKA